MASDGPSPPSIAVEGRLPDPAIIYCNEPVPLRILITRQNDSPATIFLQLLQIELLGYTGIRALELRRSEVTSWMIMSSSDMRIPLQNSTKSGKADNVLEIDATLWNQKTLPNTVTPTFDTCNLSRSYSLDIKVGLSWGEGRTINVIFTAAIIDSRSLLTYSSQSLQFSRSVYPSRFGPAFQYPRPCLMRPQGVCHHVPQPRRSKQTRNRVVFVHQHSLQDHLHRSQLDRKQRKRKGLLIILSQVRGIFQLMRRRAMMTRWRMSWCQSMVLAGTTHSSKARDCRVQRMRKKALVFLVGIEFDEWQGRMKK